MKEIATGLLASGLLALSGPAEPVPARQLPVVRVGLESLRFDHGRVAMRSATEGWQFFDPSASDQRASTSLHPVYILEGAEASATNLRVITGRLSVRLRMDESMENRETVDHWAAQVAKEYGFRDEGEAEGAAPWRLWRVDPPGRALEAIGPVRSDPRVVEAEVVVARQVARRGLPNDPLLPYQWHLHNPWPNPDGTRPVDLGVTAVWGPFDGAPARGWRGRGVRLGILDDGIDPTHPEFADGRLDAGAGRNWNNGRPGDGAAQGPDDRHGTAVAGLAAAAADNGIGVAGVAPEATLVSLRLTARPHDDADEAQALSHLANDRTGANATAAIDIKNASWGPADATFRLGGPGPLARQALATATRDGRRGRGTVFVWAAGNGGAIGEDANADGYANNPHVIAVGALDSNGRALSFSEGGACVAVVAPSAADNALPIATTDRPGSAGFNPPSFGTDLPDLSYTLGFGGTSAAAAQVAGVCALMLEANPALGWRDVKEILLRSAHRVSPASPEWITNAVGLRFHPRLGAGMVDAAAAIELATTWKLLGPVSEVRAATPPGPPVDIPDDRADGIKLPFTVRVNRRVEHVLITLTALHPYRGDLRISLTSPSGTTSVLAPSYFTSLPAGQANYQEWTFSSLHFWGESSEGQWILQVADVLPEETGRLLSAELTLLGSEPLPPPVFYSPSERTITVGQAFEHVLTSGHGPTAYTLDGLLPAGIEFNHATGTLRGRPTETGVFSILIRGVAASGATVQDFRLVVLGGYEAWRQAEEVPDAAADPLDDADRDGRSNLLEYATGSRPMVPEPPMDGDWTMDEKSWAVRFPWHPDRMDIVWQVEHSIDGIDWRAVVTSQGGEPPASLEPNRFRVAIAEPTAAPASVEISETISPVPADGMFRLRVILQP